MIPGLLEALEARFTFVVGKGGVGKSTTACAVALGLADAGAPAVHLISTDPAHSLADIFGQPLSGGRARSMCGAALTVEELPAQEYLAGWMEKRSGPLAELLERGSYLEREEVEALMGLTLPGVDEIAGTLRLVDLAGSSASRVVVDTAPTGHALRLLDTGSLLEGWVEAFHALRSKASAVAESLVRTRVRWDADAVIEELEERIAAYRERVLAPADFVLVSTPAPVVLEETERLKEELRGRELRVAARVVTAVGEGRDADEAQDAEGARGVFRAPWHPVEPGCDGVRAWGAGGRRAAKEGRAKKERLAEKEGRAAKEVRSSDEGRAETQGEVAALLRRPLLLVVGKGGVGKSTVAAALALALSRQDRVALLGVDPAGSLPEVLRMSIPPEGVSPGTRLSVRQLDASSAYREFREEYAEQVDDILEGLGLAESAGLDRAVLDSFWELAPPGIDEVFGLTEVLSAEEDADVAVVDTAPTGHLLRLLAMPELALDWTHQLMRLLVRHRAVAGLDDSAERLLRFARRLRELKARLADPDRAGAILVTLAEPVVLAESRRLAAALEAAGVRIAAVLQNMASDRAEAGPSATGLAHLPAPLLRAPRLDAAPRGSHALLEFFSSWEVVEVGPAGVSA